MFEWIISDDDAGKKLIVFLTDHLGNRYSARSIKRSLESNLCDINSHTQRFASFTLAKGDRVRFRIKEPSEKSPGQQNDPDPLRVLYEDDYLLVYDKPAKVNCDEQGILGIMRTVYPEIRLIHRLDRDTTGVLLFAKSLDIFTKMVEQFNRQAVQKVYLAIVDGIPEKKSGSIENFLGKKHTYNGQSIWGAVHKNKGVPARTDWMLHKQGKNEASLICFPITGRTHQIRVHLAGIGHPVLGDFQYCKKFTSRYRPDRHLLHAYRITFTHPVTGKAVTCEAPIPGDFIPELVIPLQI